MRHHLYAMAAAALAVGSGAAARFESFSGSAEIARGDYAAAERTIERQRRLFPRDADLMLNLALVYERTGRDREARALYRDIARQPDERVDMAQGATWSRRLASDGLARVAPVQVTTR